MKARKFLLFCNKLSKRVRAPVRLCPATLFLALLTVGTLHCSGSSQDDDQARGVALLAALGGCSINGISLSASGVSCSGGVASGTGTLTAAGPSDHTLSMELQFSLGSGGSLQVLGGSNLSAADGVINRGIGFLINPAAAAPLGITDVGTPALGLAGATDQDQTFCLEIHLDETYGHIVGKPAVCPHGTEASGSQALDKDGDDDPGGGAHGANRGWGFILTNASVRSIALNAGRRFTE